MQRSNSASPQQGEEIGVVGTERNQGYGQWIVQGRVVYGRSYFSNWEIERLLNTPEKKERERKEIRGTMPGIRVSVRRRDWRGAGRVDEFEGGWARGYNCSSIRSLDGKGLVGVPGREDGLEGVRLWTRRVDGYQLRQQE